MKLCQQIKHHKPLAHKDETPDKPIDHNLYPIIISMPNRCLVWNKEKEDWKIMVHGKEVKKEFGIDLLCKCWCGATMYAKDKLSEIETKLVEQRLNSFQKIHSNCGHKKNIKHSSQITYLIQEGGLNEERQNDAKI